MNTLSYMKVCPVPQPQKRNGALIPRLKDGGGFPRPMYKHVVKEKSIE